MPKYDPFLKKLRASDVDLYDKGKYANEATINIAYPTGELGWFVFNYDTDTWWVWDGDSSAWVDTDTKGAVDSVNGDTGVVVLVTADIGESTNLYYTEVRVAANLAVVANSAKFTNATHTGDVTGAGALTIVNKKVTLAKMNDMATASFIGRNTAGAGVPEILSVSAAKSLLSLNLVTNDAQLKIASNLSDLNNVDTAVSNLGLTIAKAIPTLIGDYTGFTLPEDVIVTGDSTARTVTLTGTVNAYYQGLLSTTIISGYTSPAHGTDTAKIYFLYSTDGVTASWVDTSFDFKSILISYATYDSTLSKWIYIRECHGLQSWKTHKEFHDTVGSYKTSGGDIGDYTLDSTTAADRRPTISSMVHQDEDLATTQALLASGSYTQAILTSTGIATYTTAQADIVPLSTDNPYYNSFSAPNFGQTLMPDDSVMSIWILSTPTAADEHSQKLRFLFRQGQWVTLSKNNKANKLAKALDAELARNYGEMNLGNVVVLSPEVLPIGRIIITYTGGNWYYSTVCGLTGSRYQQIQQPTGNFLSTVTTDDSLDGTGTVADPLGLNTFQSSFTSADSTGFVWTDNTLVITHSLAKSNLDVSLVDGSGNKLDYTMTETDLNTLTINFPVGSVPITGTWNIKIF